MIEKVRVGAYFYPNEPSCPIRNQRAEGRLVESEPVLARNAKPLFPGHDQPRSYCLGDTNWMDWDDSDMNAAAKHVELAQEANLKFFVIDSYLGIRDGEPIHESKGFLSHISEMRPDQLGRLQFAMMCCFRAPRTIMAVRPGDSEKNREFDATPDTARFIVDSSVEKYWLQPNYLKVNQRPYISFFLPGTGVAGDKSEIFRDFFDEFKNYALKTYSIEPYIVGVVSHRKPVMEAPLLEQIGVDAISGYLNLIDFPHKEPVVDHSTLIDARVEEWLTMCQILNIPVQPTAEIGLDRSPRCVYTDPDGKPIQPDQIDQLYQFVGHYPHSSIVTGSTAETFKSMLVKLEKVVGFSVGTSDEKIITINAWNELTEGSCMLPRIIDGKIDRSYINMSRALLGTFPANELC